MKTNHHQSAPVARPVGTLTAWTILRKPGSLPLIAGLALAVPATSNAASYVLGTQNTVLHSVPDIIYGQFPAADDSLFGDDSKLMSIILSTVTTWENVSMLASTFNPHHSPHENPCPPLPYTFSQEVSSTTSWTKSFSTTESSQVTSELSAEFEGIGSKLETQYSVSFTAGTEVSKTNTVTNTQTLGPYSIPAGGRTDIVQRYYWATYSGTYNYFVDTTGIGGSYVYDVPWSVTVQYANQLEPYVSGGTPCPEPANALASACLLASGLMIRIRRGGKAKR